MKTYSMDQRSDAWMTARLGIPTASQAHRIITPEGKASRQARKYLYEKVYERCFQRPWARDLSNIAHVQEGIRNEPFAAEQFAEKFGVVLETVGFCTTDDGLYGCSPDRIIQGRKEVVEIKCPLATTHIGYIVDGIEAGDYYPQMQMQMLVGGWAACHFYSYHPEMAPYYRVVGMDVAFQAKLKSLLVDFVYETATAANHLREHGVYPAGLSNEAPDEDEAAE